MDFQFTNSPEKMIEIYLPPDFPGPGLGHCLLAISSLMSWCYHMDYYPYINDTNWAYGRWTDLFTPYLQQYEQLGDKQGLPKQTFNIGSGTHDHGFYGLAFLLYESTMRIYKNFYKKIYQPKTATEFSCEFQNIDVAIHVRKGDHWLQRSNATWIKKLKAVFEQTSVPENMFVMTDQKEVVNALQEAFGFPILSLCPEDYDGNPRKRNSEGFKLLIKEVEIARSARAFVGSAQSSASTIVDIMRDGQNVFYI